MIGFYQKLTSSKVSNKQSYPPVGSVQENNPCINTMNFFNIMVGFLLLSIFYNQRKKKS
jgi:hypothetical protein